MSSTNMKKSYLLATFISSLFITGNASAETNSADAGAYSAGEPVNGRNISNELWCGCSGKSLRNKYN